MKKPGLRSGDQMYYQRFGNIRFFRGKRVIFEQEIELTSIVKMMKVVKMVAFVSGLRVMEVGRDKPEEGTYREEIIIFEFF